MSSSYIVEPQGTAPKKDDTLIIVVNDDGTISVDQETLQNLIMNQSNANVSVVRVGQTEGDAPNGDLTFTVDPPAFVQPETNQNPPQQTNTTPDIVDPFMEMDPEQLERLETALQSEQAKQILGENVTAMLDMLTVEEQQNSIRYSIELDHCYTSRTSSADPPPLDPLPIADSPDVEKVEFTTAASLPQSPLASEPPEEGKLSNQVKPILKKPVGRPRKVSLPINSPPNSTKPLTSPRNLPETPKTSGKPQEDDEDSQFSSSESSESDPSDDDVDFGPRGPRRGGVRARGGRKGLTTRGGSMSGRRPGRPSKMDVDQVRRLNMEMAAAVDEMKTPVKHESSENHLGRSRKQIKTMGGKRKEEVAPIQANSNVNEILAVPVSPASSAPISMPVSMSAPPPPQQQPAPSPPPAPLPQIVERPLQTTNQVKANLISANMIKGDMILTKPGQSRNNQKVYFVQKKIVMKANELKSLGAKKAPVVITKGPMKMQSQIQTKLATSEDGKLISVASKPVVAPQTAQVPLEVHSFVENTQQVPEVPVIPEVPPLTPAKQSPKHTVSSPVKVKPILEIKKEKKEKEKEKPEEVPKTPELKTPEPCKKHLKKDTKKSPAVLAEALGPALFSTPDIIRRVGSTGEAKAPDALGNSDCGTSVPEPMDVSPSLEAQIAPVKTDFLPLDLDIRPDEAHHHDLLVDQPEPLTASVDEHSSALLDAVEHDHEKMDQQDSVTDDLTSALDAATNPLKNEDVGHTTEDTVRSIVSDERSEIEGNEHLLATLEMEASKHEEELLAEALLLQEQLDVDLSDPTALDGASPTVPSLPEPLLSTSDFDSAILPAPVIPEKAPESPVPAPITPTTTTTTNDQRKKGSKEPIQIVRGGRVITLPPIEAPATRSKRLQSRTQSSPKIHGTPKREEKSYKPSAQNHSIKKVEEMESEMEDDDEEENSDSEDDPNRLWCICKRPHNNRFMICCDVCEDWFHGKCVHVSKAMGQQMEEQGIEWVCPNCSKKKSDEPSTPKSQKSSPTAVKSHRTPGTSAQTPKLVQPEEENVEKSVKNEAVIVAKSGGVTQCVVCKKEARNSSIYCSDVCILAHAQETLTKDKPIPVKAQGKESQKSEARVIVFERKTGKVLTGNDAPTRSNLQNWLKEHPTFEAIRANNLNTMQVGGKTVTTIQTGGSNNKSMKSAQQQNPQAKMIYAKVAGSKQTVLAPSHKKVSASPSASAQSPNVVKSGQTKTQYVITPSKTPVLKQTTIKTVPQQNKTPTVPKLVIKKTEQKASTSVQKGSHQRTLSSKKSEPEPIRLNVRKTLAELLTTRIKETEDLKLTEDEITDLGLNIELELYKYFKDTGAKYKAKYRSLVFNIKDSKNLTLFRKIADRSLTPDAVVRLSPDEMASQELAEWREKETKHQLEMIKKNELDLMAQAKSIVVKTHKGEQIIENDGGTGAVDPKTPVQDIVSVLNSGDNTSSDILEEKEETTSSSIEESRKLPKHGERKKKKDKDRDRDKEKDKDKERERENRRSREKEHKESKRDRSTSRSRKHRSRDRSRDRRKSKDGKREKERDRDKERDRGREKDKDKEKKDKDKERSSRRSKSSRSKSSHRAEHKDKDKKKIDSEDEKKVFDEKKKEASPPQSVKPIEDRLWRHVEEETTTNTIDGNDSDLSDREPSSTVNIKTPDINEEPEKDKESIGEIEQVEPSSNTHLEEPTSKTQAQTVWRGFVSMVDVAKFFITAQEISGSAKDLMDDLPGTIDVVGRISHDTVWDYISKMKKSGTKEILVIRLTAANDEEKIPYITLYSYLNSRSRLGVIGAVSKNIKDFYIMPFSSQSKIPSILMPLIGSGFEENRPHLLLGIIVRNKRKRPSVTPLPQIPQKIAKKDPERSFTPPPSVHSSKDKSFLLSQKSLADFNDETVITQTTLNSLNKAHVGMSRPGGLIDSAVISKIVPELSSKFNITASPKKAVSQDRDDDQDNSRLNDHDYDNEDTGDNNEDDDNDDNDTPVSAVSHSITENNDNTQDVDNDDDEPYSPGGIDDDIVRSSLLPRAENSTELQRKMEELNRQIEEQKQQIQSISSSFLGETVSTLPGLGLDPPSTADDEAYSPTDIRSFTPPPQVLQKFAQPILDKVQDITIPPNLQEILANVKRQQGSSNKVDPYLPSKPGASFLTSSPSVKPEKTYTPTSVKPRESKSTLRSLSDFDLIKKAEEELAAVAAASAMNLQEHPPSIMPPMMQQVPIMSPSAQPDSHFGLSDIPEMAYPTNIMDTMSKARASDQPKPPGLEDEDLPTFPSTPPNIELPNSNRSPKFLPKSGVILSVKRKSNDDGGSPSKTSRTKSRWGQGPAD